MIIPPLDPTTILMPLIEAVKAALPKIGAAIAKFVAKIPPPIMERVITVTIEVIADLAKRFLGCSDSPAELGEKAMNAEKKPEDFDSINSYIKYLEKEQKIADPEAFKNLTPEEKRERELAGTEIYRQGISEKIGFDVSDDFLIFCGKVGLDAKTVYLILDAIQKNKVITLRDFCDFFAGSIQPEKAKPTSDFCKTVFSTGTSSGPEVNEKILSMMEEARKV